MGRKQDRNNFSTTQKEVTVSLFISLVCHTIFFIVLANIVFINSFQKPLLVLSFSPQEEDIITEVFETIDIQEILIEESSSSQDIFEQQDIGIDPPELFAEQPTSIQEDNSVEVEPIKTSSIKAPKAPKIKKPASVVKSGTKLGNKKMAGSEEMESRLKAAGAKTGDIQISISWNNFNDIDLWVEYIGPNYYDQIGWSNKVGSSGGWLDVDMNVYPKTKEPVENIFWDYGSAPKGTYHVYINYYRKWDKNNSTPVLIRIINGDKIEYKKHTLSSSNNLIKIFSFKR